MTDSTSAKLVDLSAAIARPLPAHSEPEAFVSIDDVRKVFASARGEVVAVDGVSLKVHQGEFVSVVGPSGCGKTTLMNLIAGLEQKSSGRLLVKGKAVAGPITDVGVVFQDPTLMEWRTVIDNIMLQIETRKLDMASYKDHALALLENLGLSNFVNAYPSQLSGGMKQRVSIARALVSTLWSKPTDFQSVLLQRERIVL